MVESNVPQSQTENVLNSAPVVNPETPGKRSKKFVWVVVGIILLLLSLGVTAYLLLPAQPSSNPPQSGSNPSPQPQPLTLQLGRPTDGELAVNQELLVEGTTLPNTTVVLFTETDEVTLESDAQGRFEGTILLVEGINSLTATAFADSGEEKSVTFDVVYDSES